MAEQDQTNITQSEKPDLTAADVAKLVKRSVIEVVVDPKTKQPKLDEQKRPVTKTSELAVGADEVLDFAVRGHEVTVITADGQKLTGSLPKVAA